MELKLLNAQGQSASNVAAPDTIFGRDYNEALIHQVVVAYQANARSGNRKQKDREEVHHTTKKPWRQAGGRRITNSELDFVVRVNLEPRITSTTTGALNRADLTHAIAALAL